MRLGKFVRLVLAVGVSIPIALLAGAQAASSVLTKTDPALAATVFPANGTALANVAFAEYISSIVDPSAPPPPNAEAIRLAREALRKEPLSPKAYVVLAQAEKDPARRRVLIEGASRLNRRDLALQGLVLQEHLADQDYPATIDTLDQILRVHPKHSQEFFPLLATALTNESTIPIFSNLLDGSSPWHERFLDYAVASPEVVPNLARLRPGLAIGGEDFDRRLIAALFKRGDIDSAAAIYAKVAGNKVGLGTSELVDWRSKYPPFDWQLADRAEFRAQLSRDGKELEIYVKPGQGGIIASRVFAAPKGPLNFEIQHSLAPAAQIEDVRFQLGCIGHTDVLVDQRLKSGVNRVSSGVLPGDCRYLVMGFDARAWSGKAPLSGSILSIKAQSLAD
ncbi:MAG: hypothetical protein H6918_05270 [Sphingomonadaceae bacterium]|nr:hypothetical protein [Sphingomonadaceae bacterium]